MKDAKQDTLRAVREDFVAQWGALGSQWGVNRTMAMIHAHLMLAEAPQTTDEVMEALAVSRGNANTNLRELVSWGLIRTRALKGERKDFYEAEKDVWKIFCIVARERKRRETEPAAEVLSDCIGRTQGLKGAAAKQVRRQLESLRDFVELSNSIMEKVASKEQSSVLPKVLKLFS